jgi:hypothetical protein
MPPIRRMRSDGVHLAFKTPVRPHDQPRRSRDGLVAFADLPGREVPAGPGPEAPTVARATPRRQPRWCLVAGWHRTAASHRRCTTRRHDHGPRQPVPARPGSRPWPWADRRSTTPSAASGSAHRSVGGRIGPPWFQAARATALRGLPSTGLINLAVALAAPCPRPTCPCSPSGSPTDERGGTTQRRSPGQVDLLVSFTVAAANASSLARPGGAAPSAR